MEPRKKVWVFLAAGILLFSLFLGTGWAVETTAIGEGRTRQEAVNNAIRGAIEKALGTLMKSQTQVSQGKLVWDRIASTSAGYVKNYYVVAEGKDPVSDVYKVKLKVELDDHKLKTAADEFLKDPRAQRAFQQTRFDERKIIVYYVPRTDFDLPADSKGVQTVMDLIEDKLVSYGFRVFMLEKLLETREKVAETLADEKAAIDLARQEVADAIVTVSFDGTMKPTADGYNLIKVTLTLKALDLTTSEIFANVQDRDKTLARTSNYEIEDGVARAATKVGPRVVDQLTKKIVTRFSTKRAKFVLLIFRNVSPENQDRIEGILEEIGWRYRVTRQTGNYMELEVFSEADPTSVRRTIRRATLKAEIKVRPTEKIGSRIIFDGGDAGGY